MINLTLKGMNGSDMLVIQAAVVKVMERIDFHPKEIDKEPDEVFEGPFNSRDSSNYIECL